MSIAAKDFKTVNQKFKAGDALPDDIDAVKWLRFIKDDATPAPAEPVAAPAAPAEPFKF